MKDVAALPCNEHSAAAGASAGRERGLRGWRGGCVGAAVQEVSTLTANLRPDHLTVKTLHTG